MTWWNHAESRPVDWVGGACLLIRLDTLQEIGLMDERYKLYSSEVDWCYLAKHKGWQVWYVPEIVVVHLGGQSTKQNSIHLLGNIRYDLLTMDLLRFMKKFYPLYKVRVSKWIYSASMVLRIIKSCFIYFLSNNQQYSINRIKLYKQVLSIRIRDL